MLRVARQPWATPRHRFPWACRAWFGSTSTVDCGAAEDATAALERTHRGLRSLRHTLDASVVGHKDVKTALLLGLLAREHVYIEGPPGVAKTYLSELKFCIR